jgi:hypothetical protein
LTPLAAPGNFILTVDGAGAITASWDNVAGETGFFVVLATNAGFTTGVVNATKGVNILSHQFTGLLPLTTYYGHVRAIGDGVTSADSAYSTTDSDTTTAATLSTPTSFAAGTPTADGVPFTWVDPSDAPSNESSFLIQIALAADTTYSGTIVTRTPAADATSAAAGTGLTAATGYRARIKKVGNGTSTLDSAYSSEVTFTTAAASFDSDAEILFAARTAAGHTFSDPRKVIISDAFTQAKADGIFSKLKHVTIWEGNVAAAAVINAVNPGTLDATIVGTATVNDGFVGNGTTGAVNSGYIPSVEVTAADELMVSVASRDNNFTNDAFDFGCGPASTDSRGSIHLQINEHASSLPGKVMGFFNRYTFNTVPTPPTASGEAIYTVYTDRSTSFCAAYEDTTLLHTLTEFPGDLPDNELYFSACNGRYGAPGLQGFNTRKYGVMAIGDGFDTADNAALVAFMKALNNF